MKKILAFTLCVIMVLCSAVTVFANGTVEDGTVLYSATFDGKQGSPKSLEEAGLELYQAQATFSAVVDEESGLLSITETAGGRSNIAWKNDVVGDVTTYTMQMTFRWNGTNILNGAEMNAVVSGYVRAENDGETTQLNKIDPTMLYYKTNANANVKGYGDLSAEATAAWKPEANVHDDIPGNWTTITIEVNEGKLGKYTVAVVGADPVIFEAPTGDYENYTIPEGNPFIRMGAKTFGAEIYDLRIVKGINQNVQPPELPARPTLQTGAAVEVNTGNVLYYQRFNKAFNMTDLNSTGLSVFSEAEGYVSIDEDGYLFVNNATGAKAYKNTFKIPDVIPDGLATFTWESKFRYTQVNDNSTGGMNFTWLNEATNARVGLFLRYSANGKFDNVAETEPIDASVAAAWMADYGVGGWVTMKIAIKDGALYKVTISVEDIYSGQELIWETTSPELTSILPIQDSMIFRFGKETAAQFAYLRIVEGVDYTEYKGEYATKSYSGHEDSAAVEEEEEIDIPTVNDQKPIDNGNKDNQNETKDTENVTESNEIETEPVSENKGCGGFATSAVAVMGVMTAVCGATLVKRKKDE